MELVSAPDALARYDALLRVSSALAGHRTIAELFRVLSVNLHAVVPFDYLALILHDAQTDEMRLTLLEPENFPPPPVLSLPVETEGPGALVWLNQTPAVISIPAEGPLHPALEYLREHGRKATCWLPLTTKQRRLGVLSFGSCHPDDYPSNAIAFMTHVAAVVALALDSSINLAEAERYADELRRERDRIRLLLEISNVLVSQLDYTAVLATISASLNRLIKHEHASLALLDRESGTLQLALTCDEGRGVLTPNTTVPLDRSPVGVAFQRGVASVFERADWEHLNADAISGSFGLETLCCVPLIGRHGKIGTLNVGRRRAPHAFSEQDVTLLSEVATQIAIAVENALAYREIERLKEHLVEENLYLEDEVRHEFGEIVGKSRAMKRVMKLAQTVASTDSTVLLLGETGTGKELIARAIHNLSPRRDRTFVRISIPAVPAGLVESELFGHEKGAFTGAAMRKLGRLELAHGGTLFLDEIGDLPLELQPKLLRVLQEREFERLGSAQTVRVDARIVAATNRDLERLVEEGLFRSDLYYRLKVFPIHIPPLRERPEDIPFLVRHFADRFARRMHRPITTIRASTMAALCRWSWPGNIRELEHVIERAVILSPGTDLRVALHDLQPKKALARVGEGRTMKDINRATILEALRGTRGVVAGPDGAASRLGLKRTTLQSMMRKLGVRRPDYS